MELDRLPTYGKRRAINLRNVVVNIINDYGSRVVTSFKFHAIFWYVLFCVINPYCLRIRYQVKL